MNTHVQDQQAVGETESTLFSTVQQSPSAMAITMTNIGVNTIDYRFQQLLGDGTWGDLAAISPANDLNSTLQSSVTKVILVSGSFSQCRLVGSASGGAAIDFSVTRVVYRASGGSLPILSL